MEFNIVHSEFRITYNNNYNVTIMAELNDKNKQNMQHTSLEDSFDRNEIEQLHRATLGFSKQCFDLKKLCVTVEISACALAVTIFRDAYGDNELFFALKLIALFTPLLFYSLDVCTFYYQDKLRKCMFDIENKIRKRNGIQLKTNDRFSESNHTRKMRIFRSVTNESNIIYWGLIVFAILFIIFIR